MPINDGPGGDDDERQITKPFNEQAPDVPGTGTTKEPVTEQEFRDRAEEKKLKMTRQHEENRETLEDAEREALKLKKAKFINVFTPEGGTKVKKEQFTKEELAAIENEARENVENTFQGELRKVDQEADRRIEAMAFARRLDELDEKREHDLNQEITPEEGLDIGGDFERASDDDGWQR